MAEAEWQDPLKEVERIHRRILARLDESDRREAAREKERAERRAAGSREMQFFQLRVRKAGNEKGEPRFVIETREIKNPGTMILGSSEKPLTESELRTRLAEMGLTPGEVQSEIDKAGE